jgi:hypothetical protein
MLVHETLHVLAATYDDPDEAVADYEAVVALYRGLGNSDGPDAAVIAKGATGRVRIVRKHERPAGPTLRRRLVWALAAGVAAAYFPSVGILAAALAGLTADAPIRVRARATGGMTRSEMEELGVVLADGTAGLIVVCSPGLAGYVGAAVKAATRSVATTSGLIADQLAAELKKAETTGHARAPA